MVKDNSGKPTDKTRLYVGNLSFAVTTQQLLELFADYGSVTEVGVVADEGYGFVEMSRPEDAENARRALDGSVVNGRAMKIDVGRRNPGGMGRKPENK